MKTFTTFAVIASFLAVAPAYAHGSHMSPAFFHDNGGSDSEHMHHETIGGGSDVDKVIDRRHDDRTTHVDHERRDRLRMLERELARLLHRDLDGRDTKFVQVEIQRLRFEILKLEHELMIADIS
jgi:hypothetical protein